MVRNVYSVCAKERGDNSRSTVLNVTAYEKDADSMARYIQSTTCDWDVAVREDYKIKYGYKPECKSESVAQAEPDTDLREQMSKTNVYYPVAYVTWASHIPLLMHGRQVSDSPLNDTESMTRAGLKDILLNNDDSNGLHHKYIVAAFNCLPPPISVYCMTTDDRTGDLVHLMFTNMSDIVGASCRREAKNYALYTFRNILKCALINKCKRIIIHTPTQPEMILLMEKYLHKTLVAKEDNLIVDVFSSSESLRMTKEPVRITQFYSAKSALGGASDGVLNVYDHSPHIFIGCGPSYDPPIPLTVTCLCTPKTNPHMKYTAI